MVPDEGARGNAEPVRARAGSAVLALLLVYPLAQLVGWAVLVLAVRTSSSAAQTSPEWLEAHLDTPLGILLMIVPFQAMILLSTLFCVRNEKHRAASLGLRRAALPLHVSALLVLGTPAVEVVAWILGALSRLEPTSQLERIQHLLTRTTGASAWLFGLLATLVPAFCEELFFRGFVQRKLAARYGPLVGVLASGIVFALYHGDPLHVVMIIPPGLWFAYLAWRSHSTVVAMAAHLVFNLVGVTVARFGAGVELGEGLPSIAPFAIAVFVVFLAASAFALGTGLWLARAHEGQQPDAG
jgi:membrane protease YdiL (CAAX protease family)